MLGLHAKPDDYCVLFDIHEDVVALNSSTGPTAADLYQVKTKANGSWTARNLTERERNRETGAEKPSHLGNLYHNYIKFPGFVRSLYFVTNAQFSMQMAAEPPCTERDQFCITDIADAVKNEIMDKVATEHGLTSTPDGLSCTYLVRTSLSVLDHERHTVGIVADFLREHADETIPPGSFCRTLQSEIRRRNDREAAASNFADLARTKGVSRGVFQRMLDSVHAERRMDDLAATIRTQLAQEGGNLRLQGRINEEVRNYLAKRLDETNTVIWDARRRIETEVWNLPDDAFSSAKPIADIVAAVTAAPSDEFEAVRRLYSDPFLQAMVTVAIYEQPQLPPTDPQPSEEGS